MITCSDCGVQFAGTRSEARLIAHWEPNSFSSQWAIDAGPMTCAPCIMRVLEQLLVSMRRM